ncbi:GNAT family N-acetyltransferase [Vulcaniibacterium tengchongense]|uniref:RimJ/RimL family protein N-acetyltransferase n=1 Tax=Vulcaniibacterium tengchongense TaxID=1273429 RepID=A0A3N4V9J9_9GAMM|nr:GNAT family N-acetyltransferase [Vulcaniibacterium tengchongense]RPE79666.1 RimJ/RimL family protein N-acetyltransferase [Vulcaniibacterium tengchongense]
MIETVRLRLRPCRDSDKPAFAAILNTPRMTAELGGVRPRAEIDALVDKRIADQARHGHSYWAVELRDSGELIGTCGIRVADDYPGTPVQGMYEIGWRIAERHWGRGYAREAAQASLAWAWAHTPAPCVAAWTTPANERSRRLMQRLGLARRPELDFVKPAKGDAEPAMPLVVYAIDRPAPSAAP